jgi:hypothetical protein
MPPALPKKNPATKGGAIGGTAVFGERRRAVLIHKPAGSDLRCWANLLLAFAMRTLRCILVAHPASRRLVPIEVGLTSAPRLPAGGADEARLNVGQPHLIRPAIGAERRGMAATVVGAIDQDARPMSTRLHCTSSPHWRKRSAP